MSDAGVASWDSKYHYWYPRPENAIRDTGADPNWKPLIPTPFFPAYTSRACDLLRCRGRGAQLPLPRGDRRMAPQAQEAADARIWGGIHWPWDSTEGLITGRRVGELVVERAKADGANP